MRTIKINSLSTSEINKAIAQLKQYKTNLIQKNERFVKALGDLGIQVAKTQLGSGQGDAERLGGNNLELQITQTGIVIGAKLMLTSQPHTDEKGRVFYPHLAWEFGAGIYYNNGNHNPKAGELGFGVGTFPNQTHAFDQEWWYKGDDGQLHLSKGTEATMPMYTAAIEMYDQVQRIAREIFG